MDQGPILWSCGMPLNTSDQDKKAPLHSLVTHCLFDSINTEMP